MCGIVDQGDVFKDAGSGPAAGHQLFARFRCISRGPDGRDDFVDVGHSHGQTTQDMAALARFAQEERGTARHNVLAEIDEAGEEAAQRQCLGPATVQRQHVAAEVGLHGRETEELVHHHFGRRVALQLDHDAHAVAVGFVLNMRDAFDLLVAGRFCDPLDHGGLIHLIGDLVDNDGPSVLADFLYPRFGADDDAATPLKIGFARTGTAQHDTTGWEIGAGNIFDQLLGREIRLINQRQTGVDHFAKVVRRNVGRHAHGDTAGAIDQHVRKTSWQNRGLAVLAVIVVLKINGFLVDVGQQIGGRFVHAHFGIAHGRCVIAVHRSEVALTVQQRQRHGEILRHAHQRVIDRAIAVGVVLTHHVSYGAGRFAVGLVVCVTRLVHSIENAPVYGLQAITQIGDRAAYDHAHRVIEIARAHLLLDRDRRPVVHGPLGAVFVCVFRCFRRIGQSLSQLG